MIKYKLLRLTFTITFSFFLSTTLLGQTAENHSVPSKILSPKSQVGQVVATTPSTARVFELVGIDYCCGGKKTLEDAAKENDVDLTLLIRALAVVGNPKASGNSVNLKKLSTEKLIEHIVSKFHEKLRSDLPPLLKTTQLVQRVHGAGHPELKEVLTTLKQLTASVLPHLLEEERVLFPAIVKMEKGDVSKDAKKQITHLLDDHHQLGHMLQKLRKLTKGYQIPEGACPKYKEMLSGLETLEQETLQHVHIENNILIPRVQKILNTEKKQK